MCVAENAKCASNEFQCKSGQCLKMSSRCNRKIDCDDKSDELNCFIGYLTRKIRGSLRISQILSLSLSLSSNFRRSINHPHTHHTHKALIAGNNKFLKNKNPSQSQWDFSHSSQKLCRSVSSASYFQLLFFF